MWKIRKYLVNNSQSSLQVVPSLSEKINVKKMTLFRCNSFDKNVAQTKEAHCVTAFPSGVSVYLIVRYSLEFKTAFFFLQIVLYTSPGQNGWRPRTIVWLVRYLEWAWLKWTRHSGHFVRPDISRCNTVTSAIDEGPLLSLFHSGHKNKHSNIIT